MLKVVHGTQHLLESSMSKDQRHTLYEETTFTFNRSKAKNKIKYHVLKQNPNQNPQHRRLQNPIKSLSCPNFIIAKAHAKSKTHITSSTHQLKIVVPEVQ